MEGSTFEYHGKKHFVTFDAEVVRAIKTRTISGPRNPHKMQLLGRIGEALVPVLLREVGFTGVDNLNSVQNNHPDADLIAERNGQRFFISVKARNKVQTNGTLNSRYKLESKGRKVPHAIEQAKRRLAQFAWVAVQVDGNTYSAYFGTHDLLCSLPKKCNGKGILMTDDWTAYYEVLAKNERHDLPHDLFSNHSVASPSR